MKQKIVLILGLLGIFFMTPGMDVKAAGLSISANTTNVVKGGSVTVTVRADGLAGKFSITSSNGSVLSGGTSSVWLENETKSYKFTASNLGNATIKVTPLDVSDSAGNVFTAARTVTVNVVAPREKSTNNNLKSLGIEGYQISPEFSKDTLNYTVELPSEVTKIQVNATKEDGYASISGGGEVEVREGDNKIEITVTSETGKSKTYTIIATVKDLNPINVEVDGEKYTVVKRKDSLEAPEGFEETTVKINDVDIPAFVNEKANLVLVGLRTADGKIKTFSYDESTKTYKEYKSINIAKNTFFQKDATEIPEGFEETTLKIDDTTYKAYQEKDKNYFYLYGELLASNITGWFRYSEKDKTLQLEEISKEEEKKETDVKDYIIIGLGGLSLVLCAGLVVALTKNRRVR